MHSRAFDGLSGNFLIGFLTWDMKKLAPTSVIETIALDRDGHPIGEPSLHNISDERFLSGWLKCLKTLSQVIRLKNAATPQDGFAKVTSWHEGAIAYLLCNANDVQHAGTLTALYSSVPSQGNGYYVTPENLWQAVIVFSVRMLIPHTWQNHNDQFLQLSQPLSDDVKSDCLVWMLFNGSNLSAGAGGLHWNERDWSLVNHFIPFTEAQVGAKGRFESDFMVRYLADLAFSPEAQAVLDEGRKLWTRFHATQFPRLIRDEYKLGRPDAGWYQVRRSLEAYGETELTDFDPFKAAYAALSAKLRPMVYELGFLPE